MKTRSGFVSNSSSSSFIIRTAYLTIQQGNALMKLDPLETGWEIRRDHPVFYGYTIIDNFDIYEWMRSKKFPMRKVLRWHSNDVIPKKDDKWIESFHKTPEYKRFLANSNKKKNK